MAALWFVAFALGADAPPTARPATTATHSVTRAMRISGVVLLDDRTTVSGAVIVSDLGGQAVSEANGSFSLALEVPSGTAEIALTAVGWSHGVTLHAQRLIALSPHAIVVDVGELQLQIEGNCEPAWLPTFGDAPGMNFLVDALAVFDDGTGPALIVGGWFRTAGSVVANNIAKWNGSAWEPLGPGVAPDSNAIKCLVVHDAGNGPSLYAGGNFTTAGGVAANKVARWDGTSWSPVGAGMNGTVSDLIVFDDGSGGGEALYAGGSFTSSGGSSVLRVAKWNGVSWVPVGGGVNSSVTDLEAFDEDGDGQPSLFAAGAFTTAGGISAPHIARWNGTAWSTVGGGFDGSIAASPIESMEVHDDGTGLGPRLFVSGVFDAAGGVPATNVAAWNGTTWSAVGNGIDVWVVALWSVDLGSGPSLYAGGTFQTAGGESVKRIARWNGTEWLPVGGGASGPVRAFTTMDFGEGPRLVVGGEFRRVGETPASRVAVWDGEEWSRFGGSGLDESVVAMAVLPGSDCCDPSLVVAGGFLSIGDDFFNLIARWDGRNWHPLGDGFDGAVHALAVFDDGTENGPSLFAGGEFENAGDVPVPAIARWNGTSWSAVGDGLTGQNDRVVRAMTVFDDGSGSGPALFVGGHFTGAGSLTLNNIGKWDGTSWSKLKNGIFGGTTPTVRALCAYKSAGDPAPRLYAGGLFTLASSVSTPNIAKWDGVNWSGVGSGMGSGVNALAVFDAGLGEGPALYAGGGFQTAGGMTAKNIARWNGTSWAPVGGGMNASVSSFLVFDDGSGDGSALYAGGAFTMAGAVSSPSIARWDGVTWSTLGGALAPSVHALAAFDDGSGAGRALHVGGTFASSVSGDSYLAKWQPCTADCNSDGLYDWSQIEDGTLADEDRNGVPDCCEIGGECLPCFDLTGDGEVDGDDLGIVLGAWGTASMSSGDADLNHDGVIDFADLCLLLDHWGPCDA